MKKIVSALLPLLASGFLTAGTLNFHAPTFDQPYFRIRFVFEVKERKVFLEDILLNGVKAGHVLIFKNAKNIALTAPLEKGVYDFVLDYAWAAGKKYLLALIYKPEGAKKAAELEFKGISPQEGGIPGADEGFYRAYRVGEENGLERKQEVCTLTLTAAKSEIEAGNFVVFDGGREIPYQILEKKESIPPESVGANHPVTLTYKLAFALDAIPREKKLVFILKGEKVVIPSMAIELSGVGLGKTVKTGKLGLQFHPQSGQVNTIEDLDDGIKVFNKAGVIHWNPDVFVPGIAWDHSFDWNPPEVFEEAVGPLVYLNARKGFLPRIKDVYLEVKYSLEKNAPYFISETRLRADKGMGVIAVRNDEMVLFKELFDMLVYKDQGGEIVRMPLQEIPGAPFGLVHIALADLPWVGLLNSKEKYGFFSLRLASSVSGLDIAGDFSHRPGTYFYAPSDGEYVYWVRPWLYTWADYTTNNLFTYLPTGSVFYEKNAYLLMRWDENAPAVLLELWMRLTHPLRVF